MKATAIIMTAFAIFNQSAHADGLPPRQSIATTAALRSPASRMRCNLVTRPAAARWPMPPLRRASCSRARVEPFYPTSRSF
jgi:hypothetical protein